MMFEMLIYVDIWSCLCWVCFPFFGCCCLLWIIDKCGGCKVADRECSVGQWVTQRIGGGIGVQTEQGGKK